MNKLLGRLHSIKNPDYWVKVSVILTIVFTILIVILINVLFSYYGGLSGKKEKTLTNTPPIHQIIISTMVSKMMEVYYDNLMTTKTVAITPTELPTVLFMTPTLESATPTLSASATLTLTPADWHLLPMGSSTPTDWHLSPTDSPTPARNLKFNLLTPLNNASLLDKGFVRFSWEALPGAFSYNLQITTPKGNMVPFYTEFPLYDRYLESMPKKGQYSWIVVARDKKGNQLGQAGPFVFTKIQGLPAITPTPP